MFKKTALLLVVVSALFSESAFARAGGSGYLFAINAFLWNTTTEVSGVTDKSDTLLLDFKFGKTMGNGLYLGAIYKTEKYNQTAGSTDAKSYGPSIGYMGGSGFFGQFHYLLGGTYNTRSDGTGMQVDFGYMSEVSASVVVGAQLSYYSMEYKKDDNAPGADPLKVTRLAPMLILGFIF